MIVYPFKCMVRRIDFYLIWLKINFWGQLYFFIVGIIGALPDRN
jgi:hypothetical protein